jgi:hypothetical protein
MGRDSSTGYGPGANTDVVIFGSVTPRLKPQFLHASEVDRVADVFGFTNRKHAPAFVIHRVGGVDFERDRMSHGAEEFRPACRTEDDRSVMHDVVDGKDEGLTADNDGDPTDVMLVKQSIAFPAPEDLEASTGFDVACIHGFTVVRNPPLKKGPNVLP